MIFHFKKVYDAMNHIYQKESYSKNSAAKQVLPDGTY
jgi:hypothetical protein